MPIWAYLSNPCARAPRLNAAMLGRPRTPMMNRRFLLHLELMREKVADWNVYPFNIPAVAGLERLQFNPEITFFVGENGSGKSTLIEAIAIRAGFNREGGTKNFTGRNRPSESNLHTCLRLARGTRRERSGFFLRAETMFNVSTEAEDTSWCSGAASS